MTGWSGSPHTPSTRPLVILVLAAGGMVAAFWCLFMAGEMLSDPGGWYGLTLTLLWLVPMVALTVIGLLRPAWAAPILSALVALWVVASVLTVVFAEDWRAFEDTHGPVSLVVMFALAVPLLALGRSRSLLAGVLLLVVTLVPMVVGVLWVVAGPGLGGTLALAIVGMPFLVLGVLLVVIGVLDHRAADIDAPEASPPAS